MRFQRASNSEIVTLAEQHRLGAGGEARIYALPQEPGLVAKIWHKPTPERSRKLRVMLANPPTDPMGAQQHASIAWPVDLLHVPGRAQALAGFIMPRVENMRPVGEFSSPRSVVIAVRCSITPTCIARRATWRQRCGRSTSAAM